MFLSRKVPLVSTTMTKMFYMLNFNYINSLS